MTGVRILDEGFATTARLRVRQLRTAPAEPGAPRVLLLGGSNFDLTLKREFLDSELAKFFEVAVYEPRGVGRTERPDGIWTMKDYALDALSYLDVLGWPRAAVVGESFGGMTALHLAALAPERVGPMVLASATAGGEGGGSFDISQFLSLPRREAARRALFLQDERHELLARTDPQAFAAALAKRVAFEERFAVSSVDNGGYERLLRARRDHDVWRALPQIASPTLVVAGACDRQASPAAQKRMAARLVRADYWEFESGHGLLFSAPEVSRQVFGQWLRLKMSEEKQAKKEMK